MNIVNVGYASSNTYFPEPDPAGSPGLLVDVGWPGSLPNLLDVCKRQGVAFQKLSYLLVTHYHPDHAGLAQEMKDQGLQLLVLDFQLPFIPGLGRYMKPANHYVEINLSDNLVLTAAETRPFLKSIRIEGEIIATPGHSDDSLSLVLDDGRAFTGDLTPALAATDEARPLVEGSWARLRLLHVKTIHPGHGPLYQPA